METYDEDNTTITTNITTITTTTAAAITTTTTAAAITTTTTAAAITITTTAAAAATTTLTPPPINWAHIATYRVAIPVLITVGVVSSALSIVILRRPALKSLQVNRYFQLLAWCDILLFMVHLPIVISVNGCTFSSYGLAWYFAHLGWTMIAGVHSFCAYILAWLALDRCLAVWWHPGYSFMQRILVQRIRMIATAVLCLLVQIPYMVEAGVICINTSRANYSTEKDPYCINGTWRENDGHQQSFNERWHQIYRWFYGSVVRGGPGVLLLTFNLSLVVAVGQGKVKDRTRPRPEEGHKSRTSRNWERNLVITMIAMATSHLALALPISVFLVFFAQNDPDHCSKDNPVETLRHTANCLLLLEHILHPVFLTCLNPAFRRELLVILRLAKAGVKSWSIELSGESRGDASTPLTSFTNTSSHNTPITHHRDSPHPHYRMNRLTPSRNSPHTPNKNSPLAHHKHDASPVNTPPPATLLGPHNTVAQTDDPITKDTYLLNSAEECEKEIT